MGDILQFSKPFYNAEYNVSGVLIRTSRTLAKPRHVSGYLAGAEKREQHPRDAAATRRTRIIEGESISALRHVQSDAQNRRLRRRANHVAARAPTERVRSSSVPRHPSDTADARCTVCVTDGDIRRRRRRRRQRRAKNVPVSRAPMRPVFHVSPPSPSGNIVRQTPDTITYHCHCRRRCRADNDDDGSIVEQHRTQR